MTEPDLDSAVRGVLSSLPPSSDRKRDEALGDALVACVEDPAQLEASLRFGSRGPARAGRVMVERVPLDLARSVCGVLALDLPEAATRMATAAVAEGCPLIAGWDLGSGPPRAKLYANASDASAPVRRRLAERTGIPRLPPPLDAPHVIGMNILAGRIETKLYAQNPEALPEHPSALRLRESTADADVSAGTIVSWDLTSPPRPRAFFVAMRSGAEEAVARLLGEATPWDERDRTLLPFPTGVARSIGTSLAGDEEWTVYFKPLGAELPDRLEATLCCRAGDAEVGVFVEPDRPGGRAYLRTGRHAVSYRVREGTPDEATLRTLMEWVGTELRAAEGAGRPAAFSASPPAPWRIVR